MFIFPCSVLPRQVDAWHCTSEKGEEAPGEKASCPDPGSRRRDSGKNLAARQGNLP
jgi:hypothetical protein